MARAPSAYKRCDCTDQNRPKKGGCNHSWSYNLTNEQGRRTRATIPKSKGLTQAQAQAILDGKAPGAPLPPEPAETDLTFQQWAADWLSRRRAKEISVVQYESTLRVHLIPRWGKERIRSIKKAQVETWVHEMEANEKLANSTAASHWRVFKMIIRDALLNGMIDASPTHEVDGPYINETTTYVFSPDECWAIVDELPAHYRPIAMLGFGCGMRRGEVFGTCDDVINWDQKLLTVRRQLLQTKETKHQRLIVDRLKTSPRVSSKTVPLPPYLVDALQEHIERFPPQATQTVLWEHRKKLADCKRGSIRALFHTPRGNIVGPRDFTTGMWQPVMRRLGIKDEEGKLPTFHDLRHTFISTCLQNGIPEHTVAAWVGDSVDQLRRTYSHLLRDHADTHGAVAAGLTSRPQTSRFTSAA